MEGMPPLPEMKRGNAKRTNSQLDRVVNWVQQGDNTYGWCARCGCKVRAIELRWKPDRKLFGEEIQGSWECRECYPGAGKWDVIGISINGK